MDFRSLAQSLKRELDRELGEAPALTRPRGRAAAARQLLQQQMDEVVAGRRRFQWIQAARLFGLMPRQAPGLLISPQDLGRLLGDGLGVGKSFLIVGPSRGDLDRALAKSPVKPMDTAGQWAEALLPLVEEWEKGRASRQEAYSRRSRLARAQARLKEMEELRQWQARVADKAASLVPEVERLRASTRELQQRLEDLDRQMARARKTGALGWWATARRDNDALEEQRDQVSLELRMALGALHIRETELQRWQEEALVRQRTLRGQEAGFPDEFGCEPRQARVAELLRQAKDQARQLDAVVREAAVAMEQAQESLLQGARLVSLAFDEWPGSPVLLELEYDTVVILQSEALHPAFLFLTAGLARSQVILFGEPPSPPVAGPKVRRRATWPRSRRSRREPL
ncbi:MAG: hypothetical protein M1602_03470 [Firmicutes bacterium]|nr:hypothetical protein [Bacillota bacterium]